MIVMAAASDYATTPILLSHFMSRMYILTTRHHGMPGLRFDDACQVFRWAAKPVDSGKPTTSTRHKQPAVPQPTPPAALLAASGVSTASVTLLPVLPKTEWDSSVCRDTTTSRLPIFRSE